jgi:pyridine nucleotide-disulfide oxidoreductase family protein
MKKTLVLIGGGHSHVIALKLFGKNQNNQLKLILISDTEKTPYSGMLPGHIAGYYSYEQTHIDLVSLAKFAQAELYLDRAINLDLENNQVICESQRRINFDLLSIDIGSTPNSSKIVGATQYATPAKPVPQLLKAWNQLLSTVTKYPDNSLTLSIVGGGIGGVELTLNMHSRLQKIITDPKNLQINLFQKGEKLLPNNNSWVQNKLTDILEQKNIHLHLNAKVTAILPNQVIYESSLSHCEKNELIFIPSDYTFLVTEASAPQWVKNSGLSTDEKGFILVNNNLQTLSHPHIFATGDIATITNYPRPKAGVFAVRQGKPLWENLNRFIANKPLKNYFPQTNYLSLIGTGNKNAIASWGYVGWESPLLWYWKNYLDHQFMNFVKI